MLEDNKDYLIEELIQEYGNDVLRTAYMYVKDLDVAEDIFQEVFIKVNQKIGQFRGDSSIKTWMIRITINASKDYLKSAWNRRVSPITEYQTKTLAGKNEYTRIEKEEANKLIRAAVMELPGKYKDVVLCVYFTGMTMKETAYSLNIKEGTVKSRLYRAKEKLKEKLEGRI